ncbi:hypothetical protein [Streptomyces sp. NRRL F-5053]|uniref:hypothetical protein n=1 Tax=Streptomyces sp. NRRL F-5053 TaxID=1463854 RepID=UPI0004C96EF5|nr:hypothetical protein [Streptomyces sp. NRRL F-5053]
MTSDPAARHDWTTELADSARASLDAHTSSSAERREIGLMLGLFELGPHGRLDNANPLDDAPGDFIPDPSRSCTGGQRS